MVKLNTCFLFVHKGAVVISLGFWVTFAFDWIWGTLLYSKSSFESLLANLLLFNYFNHNMFWYLLIYIYIYIYIFKIFNKSIGKDYNKILIVKNLI